MRPEHLVSGPARRLAHAHGGGDRLRYEIQLGERRQLHPPYPVLEAIHHLRGQHQGQTRLARATRPGEGEQACTIGQHPSSSAISRSRPTKLVSCRGRLFFGGGLDPCSRGKSMSWPLSSGGALPDGCVGSGIASLLPTFLSGLTALYTLCSAPERLTLRTTSLCAFGRYLQKDSKFSVPKPLQSVTSDVSSYQSVGAKLNRHN